jgi:hypothetical protein
MTYTSVNAGAQAPSNSPSKSIVCTPCHTVRDNGLYRCDCGRRSRALDYYIENDGVRLICPACHRLAFEIEIHP